MFKWFRSLFNKRQEDWRKSSEYNQWRKAVRDKYSNRCAVTNKKGRLHCHHLNNASHFPKQRYSVRNGILLHETVHRDFHVNYMGGYHNKTTEKDWTNYVLHNRKRFKSMFKPVFLYDILLFIRDMIMLGMIILIGVLLILYLK